MWTQTHHQPLLPLMSWLQQQRGRWLLRKQSEQPRQQHARGCSSRSKGQELQRLALLLHLSQEPSKQPAVVLSSTPLLLLLPPRPRLQQQRLRRMWWLQQTHQQQQQVLPPARLVLLVVRLVPSQSAAGRQRRLDWAETG
jgi:hypothetical protein